MVKYILLIIYAVMSLITFILFAVDKRRAQKGAWRIKEKTLLTAAAQGGAVGALLGMYLLRHKTQHKEFTTRVPIMLVMQIALAVFCFWYF